MEAGLGFGQRTAGPASWLGGRRLLELVLLDVLILELWLRLGLRPAEDPRQSRALGSRGCFGLIAMKRLVVESGLGGLATRGAARGSRSALRSSVIPPLALLVVGESARGGGRVCLRVGRRCLGSPPNGAERLAFSALHLRGIGTAAPFEV
jgi:hypothetical protein